MSIMVETQSRRPTVESMVSFVIPCLNEELTLGMVLAEIHEVMATGEYRYEIVVADNGSSDRSVEIAVQYNARVIHVQEKGYGSALHEGILKSAGDIVVMFDADFTYDVHSFPAMLSKLVTENASMVIGSRLKGTIEPGAMPFLHRHLGTPVLTFLINHLLNGEISDCNSGMRVFYKSAYLRWNMRSPGMEYASEMIVSSLTSGDVISEVPINFRKDRRDRAPHLRRWNDGMRHLLFILSKAPDFFIKSGLAIIAVTLIMSLASLFGPFSVGKYKIFGYHTTIAAILLGFFGAQSLTQGLMLSVYRPRSRIATRLLNIKESHLFWLMMGIVAIIVALLVGLFDSWASNDYHILAYMNISLLVVYIVTIVGSMTFGLFNAHMMKRAQ